MNTKNIIAHGEVTGHYHQVIGNSVIADEQTISAPNGGEVVHQEHKPIILPKNDYDVSKVQEYDHFAEMAKEVVD